MNLVTGKIKLPQTIKYAVIDVGARESEYLSRLERFDDNETAVFMFDPLPDSAVHLSERVAKYSRSGHLLGEGKAWLDPIKSNQAFFTKAAMAETEGITEFNAGMAPACSSLLAESDENKFWCAKARYKITVLVLTLAGLLPLIDKPTAQQHGGNNNIAALEGQMSELKIKKAAALESEDYDAAKKIKGAIESLTAQIESSQTNSATTRVEQIHLKVDTEGADLAVLRGARDFLRLCDTVIIECQPDNGISFRNGECVAKDAVAYMDTLGFKLYEVEKQGGLVNIYWVHSEYRGPIPEFLKGVDNFHHFYAAIDKWVASDYSNHVANYSMS